MADETTQFILGDAAADALSEGRRGRGFFRRPKKSKKPEALTHCQNCEAPLTGAYCAECGQHAIDYRRSLWRVLIDAADSFLNWDTKFLTSMGVLLVKPWKLTNDFNAGRRARYVHPLRLYLLASIAFFLVAKLANLTPSKPMELKPEDRAELDAALGKLAAPDSGLSPEKRAKVEAARARLLGSNATITSDEQGAIDSALERAPGSTPGSTDLKRKERTKLRAALASLPKATPTPGEIIAENQSAPEAEAGVVPKIVPGSRQNGLVHFSTKFDKTKSPFKAWMESRIKDKVGGDGTKSQLFLDTLRSNIPTMMLCCVPLFAFVLKVLYVRKGRYYVEHLIYALHIHTFAYVSAVVITLISLVIARWSETARVLIVVFLSCAVLAQVFLSIRYVYGQGWFFTTCKFLLGGLAYLLILIVAVGTTAFVTLLLP